MSVAPECDVVVHRGGVHESTHRVHVAIVDGDGALVRSWGDVERVTLLRSVAKPVQALPLVEDGVVERFSLTPPELALCCASHNSEDVHIEAARSILAKIGRGEADLVCGPHSPLLKGRGREIRASGRQLTPIMSNCSGKHAGMLALAVHHGWETEGYHLPEHPVQQRMAKEVSRWSGVPRADLGLEVDGCGVPCFGLPLKSLGVLASRFASGAADGGPPRAVVDAMIGHPFMVAGTDRLCTALMAAADPPVFAKVGAEGVYIFGSPERRIGVALKVEDGAWRAAPPALLAVLAAANLVSHDVLGKLERFRTPLVKNTVGDVVGRLSVEL
ncbi:MAG: asparaginase [Longimicrobiales bacterium]